MSENNGSKTLVFFDKRPFNLICISCSKNHQFPPKFKNPIMLLFNGHAQGALGVSRRAPWVVLRMVTLLLATTNLSYWFWRVSQQFLKWIFFLKKFWVRYQLACRKWLFVGLQKEIISSTSWKYRSVWKFYFFEKLLEDGTLSNIRIIWTFKISMNFRRTCKF